MAGKLKGIINSILARNSKGSSETLVVATHLQQMTQWMIRQGLRFYPKQDIDGEEPRKMKLDEVMVSNRLDLYLPGIIAQFLCSGSLLWYLRPSGASGYEIHWYQGGEANDDNTEYMAYYKPGGRVLDKVIIRYSYEDYSQNSSMQWSGFNGNKKWIRLVIDEKEIIKETYLNQPPLTPDGYSVIGMSAYQGGGLVEREVNINSLGFIPCAVSPNNPMRPGDRGSGEFNWLQSAIEAEDDMRSAMVDNVFKFSSPSLVTTRPAQQITEALEDSSGGQGRPSWSQHQGYGSPRGGSSRNDDPWVRGTRFGNYGGRGGSRTKVASIIGNVLPEERFGYIFPDPINGDQWRFAQEYREGIHECLGGIDPLGTKSGMTFGEVKSLHGKVAATANQKCKSLWSYGLAKILEMVIRVEEDLFSSSYRQYMVTMHPQSRKFRRMLNEIGEIPDAEVLNDFVNVSMQMMPPGVTGLAPYGDRTVLWKWDGPVFEKTSEDKLKDSIVVRNQQELGVGSLEALQELFPDKDPRELKAMLTGVPFRFIQSVSSSIGTLLSLQRDMASIPDPLDPSKPLAARMDLTGLIDKQIQVLQKEISYAPEFDPHKDQDLNYEISGESDESNFDGSASGELLAGGGSSPGYEQRGSLSSGASSAVAAGLPGFGGGSSGYAVRPDNAAEWSRPIPSGGSSVLSSSSDASGAVSPGLYPGVSGIQPGVPPSVPGIPIDILFNPSLRAQLYGGGLSEPVSTRQAPSRGNESPSDSTTRSNATGSRRSKKKRK